MPEGAIKKTARRIGTAKLRNFFRELGPGLITGAADDDPSGISTYSVAGASFGYGQLWTALFSFPLMTAVQLMCARLGDRKSTRLNSSHVRISYAVFCLKKKNTILMTDLFYSYSSLRKLS